MHSQPLTRQIWGFSIDSRVVRISGVRVELHTAASRRSTQPAWLRAYIRGAATPATATRAPR